MSGITREQLSKLLDFKPMAEWRVSLDNEIEFTLGDLATLALRGLDADKYQTLNAKLVDDFAGTPCEQIRHAQEVESLTEQLAAREGELLALRRTVGDVCEEWTLPHDARKILETAIHNPAQSSLAIRKGIEDGAYERAAKVAERRRDDIFAEYGSVEADTGAVDYGSGARADIYGAIHEELDSTADEIRALKATP